MDEPEGRWTDPPILPELVAPPPHLIEAPGAVVVRVHDIDNPNRRLRGFTEAVVIARAPIPGGGWAGLCAWLSGWHGPGPHGAHTTGKGRFAWCRIEDRVQAWRPPHPYFDDPDRGWHGHGEPSEVADAIRAAAATLPEGMREAALRPKRPRG